MGRRMATAVGLGLGFAMDRALRDPRRWHPVAGFGSLAAAVESVTYRDSRVAGAVHEVVLVGGIVLAGVAAQQMVRGNRPRRRSVRRSRPDRADQAIRATGGLRWRRTYSSAGGDREMVRFAAAVGLTALSTWTVLGGTTLARTGREMADRLEAGDLSGARALLPALCGRDPEVLDADGLARAAVESIAENTSDATVAPLVWGALGGIPGLLAYRAVNTLDAMVGYRNDRYRNFGWAAARTDDLANLLPARLSGVLTAALAPLAGGSPAAALRTWRRDAAKHPSPNAGVAESAMAGALGISLGGRTDYRHGTELRPTLGDGPAPRVADLRRAVRLSEAIQFAAALLAALILPRRAGRIGSVGR